MTDADTLIFDAKVEESLWRTTLGYALQRTFQDDAYAEADGLVFHYRRLRKEGRLHGTTSEANKVWRSVLWIYMQKGADAEEAADEADAALAQYQSRKKK